MRGFIKPREPSFESNRYIFYVCKLLGVYGLLLKGGIIQLIIYSEKDLAKMLNLSVWTIRLFRIQGNLPHFRTAGRIFYRLEAVKQWMEEEEHRNVELSKGKTEQNTIKRIM